jgi:hypothetical protein
LEGNTPFWPGFDVVLARSTKTGTIFLANGMLDTDQVATTGGAAAFTGIYRSVDNGQTFSGPSDGAPGFVEGVDVADKPWIAVDNYPGPGYGNVYLAWTNYNASGTALATYLTYSTDDGLTWGPSGGVPIATSSKAGSNYAHGVFLAVGPDHAVYAFYWRHLNGNGEIEAMRKSTDYGQSFGPEVVVANLKTTGVNGDLALTYSNTNSSSFRTNAYPQAAINPVTGDIYVVYNDAPKGGTKDKADIFFTTSTDGGNTWSNPLRVNDDATNTDQWEPAIALTPDGTHLFITWYDRRNDPTNDSLIDRYGGIGTVSAHTVTFAANFRITDVSFPPAFDQDPYLVSTGPRYMGDYDMATADNNYFYTTWGDNRLPDAFFANQPDVRFAKIPVTGLDSAATTMVPSSAVGAPAGPTGTAAVPLPNAGLTNLAGGGDLLAENLLAADASAALFSPTANLGPAPEATTPADTEVGVLTAQGLAALLPPPHHRIEVLIPEQSEFAEGVQPPLN